MAQQRVPVYSFGTDEQGNRVAYRDGERLTGQTTSTAGSGPISRGIASAMGMGPRQGGPQPRPLYDRNKMKDLYGMIDQSRSRGNLRPGAELEGAYYKAEKQRYIDQQRPRRAQQLEQLGTSVYGGSAKTLEQYERAAQERALGEIQSRARQNMMAERDFEFRREQAGIDNYLKAMGFEAGIADKEFANQFQQYLTQRGLDRQQIQDIFGFIGGAGALGISLAGGG